MSSEDVARGAGEAAFEVRTDDSAEGAVVLRLEGELDLASVDKLETELDEAESGRPELLVLDLRELVFIDSSGLRLMLMAGKRAREEGRRLIVVRGRAEVDRILEMTGADQQLEVVSTPPELS